MLIQCKIPVRSASRASDAPGTTASPQAGSRQSEFSFCNDTGGKTIACFVAELTFTGRNNFNLTSIALSDDLCDNRSVYASIYSQASYFGQFYNTRGCGNTVDWAGPYDFADTSHGVEYVYIDLYAANSTSESSHAYSPLHYNPYY